MSVRIVKRNSSAVQYDGEKIKNAVRRAMAEGEGVNEQVVDEIEREIFDEVSNEFHQGEFTVEMISDMVEDKLLSKGFVKSGKRYIIYRREHAEARNKGWDMTDLQYDIWSQKYEWDNEGFEGFLDRVSGGNDDIKKLIRQKKFIPAGRILANRGLYKLGRKITYSNCYVLESPEDNIESIFETAGKLARTFSYGGGCGIDISKLRPKQAKVNNAALTTTGSVSFMPLYSLVTELIGAKGRRGALMLSIDCNHPDLEDFIDIKNDLTKVTKANISIKFNDDFMQAVKSRSNYDLKFTVESTGEKIVKTINAYDVFRKMAESNHRMGEPGFLANDRINSWHLLSEDAEFEFASVNPCAEEPLPAGGSCLLASLNLSEFVLNPFTKDAKFDFESFDKAVRQMTIYLNEILDEGLPLHPLEEQRKSVSDWRQIGGGVFGLADMLIKMGIRYGSEKSLEISDEIGRILINGAMQQSALLAKEYGTYPKYKKEKVMASEFFKYNATPETIELVEKYGLRNSQLTTIPPTGSVSTMLGSSGAIEPLYMVSYTRKTETLNAGGDTYYKVFTPIAREYMEKNNIKNESDLPEYFVTAMTLNWKDRIKMQSTWQKRIDASISSTVNLPEETTVDEVMDIYLYAWTNLVKGLTVFRDNCERTSILMSDNSKKQAKQTAEMSILELQDLIDVKISNKLKSDPNTCPICGGKLMFTGGCSECQDCGYSPCSL